MLPGLTQPKQKKLSGPFSEQLALRTRQLLGTGFAFAQRDDAGRGLTEGLSTTASVQDAGHLVGAVRAPCSAEEVEGFGRRLLGAAGHGAALLC